MADNREATWTDDENLKDILTKYVQQGLQRSILGDPGAASREDAIFSGERCFQATVYFKGKRAPWHLVLPNQFQKCPDPVPLIGQKKNFWPIREEVHPGDTNWFSSSIGVYNEPERLQQSRGKRKP